jgi:hypothetical protein
VEKDVVLVDVAAVSRLPAPMEIDGSISPSQNPLSDSVDAKSSNKGAIKVIKKMEYQLLCSQHNPVSVNGPFPGLLCSSRVLRSLC